MNDVVKITTNENELGNILQYQFVRSIHELEKIQLR